MDRLEYFEKLQWLNKLKSQVDYCEVLLREVGYICEEEDFAVKSFLNDCVTETIDNIKDIVNDI